MISQGLRMLKRAIDERPRGGMQTGIPKVQMSEAYAVRAVAELEWAQQRITELEAQLKERDEQNAKLFKLARKTLWLANCWNDHNFGHPQDEVKELVGKMGLDTLEKANAFLAECEPKDNKHE